MTIPNDTLTEWSALKERGDIQKLVKITGLSRSKVYMVLNGTAECTTKEAAKFAKFFSTRKAERESVSNQFTAA